uniref:ATP synthase subunit 8 n=1 Tax=Leipothrix sp. 1 XFX-2017 TaxID=1955440 RepID=A0A1S5XVY6_9ACAR|nr:ATP synthase subunit 8 [Leipothrix sp. 1 XFX-2017]
MPVGIEAPDIVYINRPMTRSEFLMMMDNWHRSTAPAWWHMWPFSRWFR